jgi:choline kinase
MKYVVLAAGSGIDSITSLNNIPKCLLDINGKTVIQNIEEICNSNNIEDINIVGGFEILKIIEKYPYHKFFYNERWKETNSLYSLHKAINIINDDIIVSYSDIVHNSDTIKNLIHNTNKIRVIYDSLWESRYEDRRADYLEKIFNTNGEMLGEFAGLFFIPKDQVPDVKVKIDQLLDSNLKSSILDLINLLLKLDAAEIVDIHGNWAELDSLQDIEHFKFGTKAETLKSLQGKLKLSFILDQYTFNIEDYKDNKNIIINNIQSKLSSKLLVVRSSALNEDTHNSSNAGSYESILKVIKDDHSNVKDSIEMVIGSYTKNNQLQNDKNQILIQPYLENVTMSGVVFTKNLQTNSPYYTINYSKGNNTESVTSGGKCDLNTFICYRKYEENIGNK